MEPTDYQIGSSNFLGLTIDLSRRPLIPRVETEYWTELAIKAIKTHLDTGCPSGENQVEVPALSKVEVLDIFAGSGCVGLAVVKNIPEAQVTFVDIEPKFIEQIKFNAGLNNIDQTRLNFFVADVFAGISSERKYDFILANPPYIPEGRKGELDKSVTDFEPHGALFAGSDGLDLIKKFLAGAREFLAPAGSVWLEFDTDQKETIEKLLPGFGYQNFIFHRDQYDRWRFVVIAT